MQVQMSSDATKKRRVDADSGGGTTAAGSGDIIIAEMKVQMTRMQNEMNNMKGRLSEIDMLKQENNHLKARCCSLERSMKVLIDERKWEYSAPDIPESYWDERGFDQDYIEDMKYHFLEKIKEATCKLRSGRGMRNEWITMGNDNSDTALLHDDALIPHWKELINAMQLYQKEKPFRLSIINIQLSTSVIDLLMPVLKNKPIGPINLQNNSFVNGREGIEFAVGVMKSNETIQGFYWTSNTINSMEDARYLVEAVNSHPTINKVRLENCFGDDTNGYDILCSLLNGDKAFAEIDLDDNNIRTGGGTAISDHLATNSSLKKLFLANNNLNDEDAVLIARALKHNTNLEELWLGDNDFSEILYDNGTREVGFNALCKAIYDPTSLNSLSNCNHTCYMYGVDFDGIGLGNIPSNLARYTPKQNRARKLHHLLSVRNREGSNVHHFNLEFGDDDENDESLKLVPNLLESVHCYAVSRVVRESTDYVPPLSITYEILRGWKMPELYQLR